MTYQIVDCSPRAAAKITDAAREAAEAPGAPKSARKSKYPLHALSVGMSLLVPFEDAAESSLRVTASARSCEGKKFAVVRHNDLQLFEIARIA